MSTINLDYILDENKKLARLINDFGDILYRENPRLYEEMVIANFDSVFDRKMVNDQQNDFLNGLYQHILDKLKQIKF